MNCFHSLVARQGRPGEFTPCHFYLSKPNTQGRCEWEQLSLRRRDRRPWGWTRPGRSLPSHSALQTMPHPQGHCFWRGVLGESESSLRRRGIWPWGEARPGRSDRGHEGPRDFLSWLCLLLHKNEFRWIYFKEFSCMLFYTGCKYHKSGGRKDFSFSFIHIPNKPNFS